MRKQFARQFARSLTPLALFAMMLLTLVPQANAYWQCEGQKCGSSALVCCCAQPVDNSDPRCETQSSHFEDSSHAAEMGPCPVDCHCSVVLEDGPQLRTHAVAFLEPTLVYIASAPFTPQLEVPYYAPTVQALPSRGPPLRRIDLAWAPRRGPPALPAFRTTEPNALARV